ncbi:MAG: tetratricopeptide repeat protein [Magnetococcales bacterium]|nr:tetratricopeptide repeat protein [Magnetococcales bacterium]
MKGEGRLRMAISSHRAGALAEAERLYLSLLRDDPDQPDAHHNLGVLCGETGRVELALEHLRAAVRVAPGVATYRTSLIGVLFAQALRIHQAGGLQEAQSLYGEILALDAGHADALHLMGMVLHQAGEHAAAVEWIRRALVVDGRQGVYHANLGVVMMALGRLEEAAGCVLRAVGCEPENAEYAFGLGVVRKAQNRLEEAEAAYRRALALRPEHAEASNNLGVILAESGRIEEAEACWRHALSIKPVYAEPYNNIGNLLRSQGCAADAEASYRKAVELQPAYADGHLNLGKALFAQHRLEEAVPCFRRALDLRPGCVESLSYLVHLMAMACDWQGLSGMHDRLMEGLRAGQPGDVVPFVLLSVPSSPLEQLACATAHARRRYPAARLAGEVCVNDRTPQRLRVGYLSGDFREHPVAVLVAELFERHDRARFEIIAYAHGPEDAGQTRQRIRAGCDRFVDLEGIADAPAAQRIAADGVHILVDLQGFTSGARPGILAHAPAPVRAGWLGYPGTLGRAGLLDYLIGDPVVTPPEHAAHFGEHLAVLPHCYLPGDNRGVIEPPVARSAAGVPEEGFLFCSFNPSWKFNADSFAIWCRLLHAVPGSVLWLRDAPSEVVSRLRGEAAHHRVDPERLLFAPRTATREAHLQRLSLADLALDTHPYNSHATGMDALSCGVPLVTRIGESFAGRVGASLLQAAGLPELIAGDWDGYCALAVALAQDQERRRALRHHLTVNRSRLPLFDSARFARDLERLFEAMWHNHRAGQAGSIRLDPS